MSEKNRRRVLMGLGAAVLLPAALYGLPLEGLAAREPRSPSNGPKLDKKEVALVGAVAEVIIPYTDTPGAIGAGVPAFIAMMYADWMLPSEQAALKAALALFDARAREQYGREFSKCTASQQQALVAAIDKLEMATPPHHGQPKSPYALFKALTVVGYYTSAIGQQKELKAEMSAGQFHPGGPVMMTIPFKL